MRACLFRVPESLGTRLRIFKMAGRIRRHVFQSDTELQQFVLPEVRPTGRKLGVGSYGSVEELEMNGLVCAGKRMHDALLEQGNIGATNIARKYLEECQVRLSSASGRHQTDLHSASRFIFDISQQIR